MKKNRISSKVILLITVLVIIIVWWIFNSSRNESQFSNLTKSRSDTPVTERIQQVSPAVEQKADDLETYVSNTGGFSIKYPKDYKIIITTEMNKIQILSNTLPNLNTNLRFTINYKNISSDGKDAKTFQNLIDENPVCEKLSAQTSMTGNINGHSYAKIYPDTPCGQYMQTVVYSVNNNYLYIITLESYAIFSDIKPYADKLFAKLKFSDQNSLQPTLAVQ